MKIWVVEYNFKDGRFMEARWGFESQDDAEQWALEHTDDGRVTYFTPIK